MEILIIFEDFARLCQTEGQNWDAFVTHIGQKFNVFDNWGSKLREEVVSILRICRIWLDFARARLESHKGASS